MQSCPPSSNSLSTLNRVEAWLQNTPPASPASPTQHSQKRHRDADMPRNSSPKRQRIDTDDVLPTQSASQVGSISVVDLSDRTTLTAPQGLKRSSSPTRNLTELRTATPSISLSPFNQVKQQPPANISAHISSLRNRLGRREGLEISYIPAGLRNAIESDMLFAPSLAMDPIDPEAYDYNDTRPASHPLLVNALERVKNIFQDACHCTEFGRDENAWCFRVVWPLVELAIKLHCNTKFKLESVQSQSIQPSYLSTVPEPTSASPSRRVALTRKTDFCFSYSCFDPRFAELYTQLAAKTSVVSHTSDNCTQRLALFSGIEVKPENGDLKEAELQISIWMAASLRKKMELARLAFPTSDLSLTQEDAADNAIISTDKGLTTFQSSYLLEPAITIIGNEHKIYYAYPSSLKGDVTVLGPDERFSSLSTRSVQGIFKLVRFYGRMLAWGVDEEATSGMQAAGLWDAFLSPVLETLAKGG
ncbi:hypothetical protein GGP41_003160 [Bipolaris sorokiniana]|uniref:PD-(D/E)XK nuclease-like domain-containing protein n=1 Tax=Cochliobolus sativus TaxID=45130 RepID=A0A8H5Z6Z9_COCSA|nr:hypothetical protein GGP41_003160 [Bipolaris sorokiniana]